MPAIHVDETALRVDSKNRWIHVYATGGITLKFLHPGRDARRSRRSAASLGTAAS